MKSRTAKEIVRRATDCPFRVLKSAAGSKGAQAGAQKRAVKRGSGARDGR